MNILIWSPFLQKVGTTTNVLNLINSINKYSKKDTFKIDLLDVYGEWDNFCTNCNAMADTDDDGIWTDTISMGRGDYKFIFLTGRFCYWYGL